MKITTKLPPSAADIQRPILMLPFTIRRDRGREDCGWRWHGIVGTSADAEKCKSPEAPLLIVPQIDKYMPTADYCIDSVPEGEPNCFVERKSDDLIASLSSGHTRFRGEHERLRQLVAAGSEAWVIVEQSLSAVLWDCDYGGRRLSSETVLTAIATWQELYSVRWIFAGDRATAERMSLKIFRLWWDRREHGKQRELFQ
jgi:hypothetical protein